MLATFRGTHLLSLLEEKRKPVPERTMVVNSPWLFLRRLNGGRGNQSPHSSYPEDLGATVDQGNEAYLAYARDSRPPGDALRIEICSKNARPTKCWKHRSKRAAKRCWWQLNQDTDICNMA